MVRRASLIVLVFLFCAASAWPKWKPEEQEYLDNQFRTLQEQIQALKKQNDALTAQVAQMRQDQAEFQLAMVREQRKLEELAQLVSSLRIGNEENFSNVKTAIGELSAQQEKSFNDLIGRSAQTAAATTPPTPAVTAAPPPPAVKGYVTAVKGDTLTLDLGSSQGMHEGSKLQLFKATDLNTPVGEIEITDVTDSSTSHARVISLNPGVRAEFSDVVRREP
jgi:cell division protein FtsB